MNDTVKSLIGSLDRSTREAVERQKLADGGQAMPRPGFDGLDSRERSVDGMSLLDFFANSAMRELLSRGAIDIARGDPIEHAAVPHLAYEIAMRMLEERAEVLAAAAAAPAPAP